MSLRKTSIVPGGLKPLFHSTQHSAFGCVLGYHVTAPMGLDFWQFVPPSQPEH